MPLFLCCSRRRGRLARNNDPSVSHVANPATLEPPPLLRRGGKKHEHRPGHGFLEMKNTVWDGVLNSSVRSWSLEQAFDGFQTDANAFVQQLGINFLIGGLVVIRLETSEEEGHGHARRNE
jgi:hypothetical protein